MPRHNKKKFKKKKTKKLRNKRGKNRHNTNKKRKIKTQRGGWPPSNDAVAAAENPAPTIWGTALVDITAGREGRWRSNKNRRQTPSESNEAATEVKWVGGAANIADRVETLAGTALIANEQLEYTNANRRKLKIRVKFDSPDAGYFDLKNPKVAKVIADCEAEARAKGKTVNDILFQTDGFWLGDRADDAGRYITISFKLFGLNTLRNRPTYERGPMNWGEIECDAYTGTRAGISEATIKATPCSAGNTERRIFYKVKGNFFHFLKGLNDGSISESNYIIWFHVANHIFRTNSGNKGFTAGGRQGAIMVHSHNEDVPFFHLKAVRRHRRKADVRGLAFNRNRNDDVNTNAEANAGHGMQTPAGVAEKIGDITNIPDIYGYSIRNTPVKRYNRYGASSYTAGIAFECIRSGALPRVKHSAPNLIVCRGTHFTQEAWNTIFGDGTANSGDQACRQGRFNMDCWRNRLENPYVAGAGEDISYWSLNPRVACSYSVGDHAFEFGLDHLANRANTNVNAAGHRGVGVFIIARFDFRGGITQRGQQSLPKGIVFETDNHKNKPIGVRPWNPRALTPAAVRQEQIAHEADFAGIAKLAGVQPSELSVRGLSSRGAGLIALQTIQECGAFAPHNIAGIYIPHNLAQLVLSADSYQYIRYLEAIVYNFETQYCSKHIFPLDQTLPVPGLRVNWVHTQNINSHLNMRRGDNSNDARRLRIERFCSSYIARVAGIKQLQGNITEGIGEREQLQLGQAARELGNWQSIGRTYIRQIYSSPHSRGFLRRLLGNFETIRTSAANRGAAAGAPAGITFTGLQAYNNQERRDGRPHLNNTILMDVFRVLTQRSPTGMISRDSLYAIAT